MYIRLLNTNTKKKITAFSVITDVDLKRNRQFDCKRHHNKNQQQQKTLRRKSTTDVMNSHASAINLQSSGQTAVVGHHRGFSQVSSAVQNSTDCPWFLPHQMPPTAPVRHNKRPAPQPGIMVQHQQQQQQQQLQQQQQIINNQQPPQLPPHSQNAVCLISFLFQNKKI